MHICMCIVRLDGQEHSDKTLVLLDQLFEALQNKIICGCTTICSGAEDLRY